MEQNMQYLMWLKSKQILNSHFQVSRNSFSTSWEEHAFAEDAAGPLGGFVWPPRSYTCSFCRREFRSAQALGGHMNVHRRDRARLKQSLSPQAEFHQLDNNNQTPSSLLGTQQHAAQGGDSSPFSSASRASAATVISQENSSEEAYVSPFSSSITREQNPRFPYSSSPDSGTVFGKSASKEGLSTVDHEDTIETSLSMGLNLFDSHNAEIRSTNSKRHKSGSASFHFFHKPCSSDRYPFQYEVLRMKTSSIEDIDLELRLGDPPAVK